MKVLSKKEIEEAKEILLNGDILAIPTETVYGLACIYDSKESFDKLVEAKKRPPNAPFAMVFSSPMEANKYIKANPKAQKVMNAFLPGELTVLAVGIESLPWHVTLGTGIVGVRIPDDEYVCDLVKAVGKPLLLTSANIHSEPPAKDYKDVIKIFEGKFPAVVEGNCISQTPTTIVSVSDEKEIKLIRQGKLSFEEIKKVWEAK